MGTLASAFPSAQPGCFARHIRCKTEVASNIPNLHVWLALCVSTRFGNTNMWPEQIHTQFRDASRSLRSGRARPWLNIGWARIGIEHADAESDG